MKVLRAIEWVSLYLIVGVAIMLLAGLVTALIFQGADQVVEWFAGLMGLTGDQFDRGIMVVLFAIISLVVGATAYEWVSTRIRRGKQ